MLRKIKVRLLVKLRMLPTVEKGAFHPRICGLTEILSFARFPQISVNLVFAVPNQEGSALAA